MYDVANLSRLKFISIYTIQPCPMLQSINGMLFYSSQPFLHCLRSLTFLYIRVLRTLSLSKPGMIRDRVFTSLIQRPRTIFQLFYWPFKLGPTNILFKFKISSKTIHKTHFYLVFFFAKIELSYHSILEHLIV